MTVSVFTPSCCKPTCHICKLCECVSTFVSVAHLGAPVLATYATASSLCVNVTLPLGPYNISVGDIIRQTRNPHFTSEVIYTLQITEPAWAEHVSLRLECKSGCPAAQMLLRWFLDLQPGFPVALQTLVNTTGSFAINFRKKAAKFCGYVVYRPSSGVGRSLSDIASFCVPVQHEEGQKCTFILHCICLIFFKRSKQRSMLLTTLDYTALFAGV